MEENKKNIHQSEYPNFIECALAIHGSVTPKVMKKVLALSVCAGYDRWWEARKLWEWSIYENHQ
ncbi:MAG: hypothetical protein Q8R79_07475 [Legionellaceae bacterium]|nr:hypothetical protein [Legionellaceae bacterium]